MGRQKKPDHDLAGQSIGEVDCPHCKSPVEVRVAVTGTCFANCRGVLTDKACGTRVWYGVKPSREMISVYEGMQDGVQAGEKGGKQGGSAANDNGKPAANDNGKPAGSVERKRSGFLV